MPFSGNYPACQGLICRNKNSSGEDKVDINRCYCAVRNAIYNVLAINKMYFFRLTSAMSAVDLEISCLSVSIEIDEGTDKYSGSP
jgi:hypothetical protein